LALGWAFAYFGLLDSAHVTLILVAIASGFLTHAIMYGPQAAFITEQFPTKVRYAGASLAYTVVGIVGGGIAPVIFASLWRAYGTTAMSLYLGAALAVSAVAILLARETRHLPLE
jgi:fucose permease